MRLFSCGGELRIWNDAIPNYPATYAEQQTANIYKTIGYMRKKSKNMLLRYLGKKQSEIVRFSS